MGELTPVFDYSFGTPWLETDAISTAMDRAREAGESVADAYSRAEVEEFRTNPSFSSRYHDLYRESGVDVLSITLGTRINPALPFPDAVGRDLARWQARFDAADWLTKVTTPEQARETGDDDTIGVILNTQNLGSAIDGEISVIDELYDAGVRIAQLTYNRQNLIGTGCTDYSRGGLSAHGRTTVKRLNELGMVLDLSHCNPETTFDGVEHADGPVAYTHVSCGSIADHDRAKSDEELQALAETDGYVGIVAIPQFLAPGRTDPPFDVFFDHIEHAVGIVGIDRVGIGTDFSNLDVDIPNQLLPEIHAQAKDNLFRKEHQADANIGKGFGSFKRYTDWQIIVDGLRHRFSEEATRKILGGNFMDFWDRVVI